MGQIVTVGQDGSALSALIANDASAKVRVIDAAAGIYEVHGLTEDQIRNAAPTAEVEANRTVRLLDNGLQARIASVKANEARIFAEPEAAPGCKWDDPTIPSPGIESSSHPDLNAPSNPFSRPLVEKTGAHVALKMVAAQGAAAGTKYAWVVSAPRTSKHAEMMSPEREIELNLDVIGEYDIFLLSKNPSNQCALAATVVGATYTRAEAYKGVREHVKRPAAEILAKTFPHLPFIHALDLGASQAKVRVAIIDSGVTYNHSLLTANIALKDQALLGKNFVNEAQLPQDDNGHGTHVAGLVASSTGGVATRAEILPVKAMNALGMGDTASVVGAIYFAVDNGADVINMSLGFDSNGGTMPAPKTMVEAVEYARKKGVLIVAAAGNETTDNDVVPSYPASIPASNVLAVAAVNLKGALTEYSNWGETSVDLAAPGGEGDNGLQSCDYLEGDKGALTKMSGTSMASPVMAGVAARILQANKSLTPSEVKKILVSTGHAFAGLKGKIRSGKVVDAAAALEAAKPAAQPARSSVVVAGGGA